MKQALPSIKTYFRNPVTDKPLQGGKVWTYVGGSIDTHKTTWADPLGSSANTNPVILEDGGAHIYLTTAESYKIIVMDADDVVIDTQDNVMVSGGGEGSDGESGTTILTVTQESHPFTTLTPVYYSEGTWLKAKANDGATVATHIVTGVVDTDTFKVANNGRVEVAGHGLTPDEYYFTDDEIAGNITTTEPAISNPIFKVFDSTLIDLFQWRPSASGGGGVGEGVGTLLEVSQLSDDVEKSTYVMGSVPVTFQNTEEVDVLTLNEGGMEIEGILKVRHPVDPGFSGRSLLLYPAGKDITDWTEATTRLGNSLVEIIDRDNKDSYHSVRVDGHTHVETYYEGGMYYNLRLGDTDARLVLNRPDLVGENTNIVLDCDTGTDGNTLTLERQDNWVRLASGEAGTSSNATLHLRDSNGNQTALNTHWNSYISKGLSVGGHLTVAEEFSALSATIAGNTEVQGRDYTAEYTATINNESHSVDVALESRSSYLVTAQMTGNNCEITKTAIIATGNSTVRLDIAEQNDLNYSLGTLSLSRTAGGNAGTYTADGDGNLLNITWDSTTVTGDCDVAYSIKRFH